ncbi:MAG: hypothetical protein SWX82_23090 [Cyanobacteriota bacterium]|nr:hypothetical protein [Cyanobacteriota bacterium]
MWFIDLKTAVISPTPLLPYSPTPLLPYSHSQLYNNYSTGFYITLGLAVQPPHASVAPPPVVYVFFFFSFPCSLFPKSFQYLTTQIILL